LLRLCIHTGRGMALQEEGSNRKTNLSNAESLCVFSSPFSESKLRTTRKINEKKMEERDTNTVEPKEEDSEEDLFSTQEITIEEMAIDGICGVY